MRMGLKWGKCARSDHVGRALLVTRPSLRRAGERRCGSDAGRDDEEERKGAPLRIHNSAPHNPPLPLAFSLSLFPAHFPSAKRSTLRTHFFPRDFLFLFSASFPALLSSIYVPASPSACAPSTPLAPTASPLMVSASAVSISAFYLLSAVSVLFFTSRLSSLAFLSQRRPHLRRPFAT